MTVRINEQIECVQRELTLRRRVYARRVANDQMSPAKAALEIGRMEAVLATLQSIEKGERLI